MKSASMLLRGRSRIQGLVAHLDGDRAGRSCWYRYTAASSSIQLSHEIVAGYPRRNRLWEPMPCPALNRRGHLLWDT